MESRKISDDQITASLYTSLDHAPYRARLYNQESASAWTTLVGSHWLQIDLRDRSIRITRVATQGRYSYDQWVTTYQLQYGDDGVTFQYYRDKQAVIKVKYIYSLKLTFFHLNPVLRSFGQPDNTLYNNAAKCPKKHVVELKALTSTLFLVFVCFFVCNI